MTQSRSKRIAPVRLAAGCFLALSIGGATLHAQQALPLSGPAFVLADEAYKAYARGDYSLAEEKVREALRLRPDADELRTLLNKVKAAPAEPAVARSKARRSRPLRTVRQAAGAKPVNVALVVPDGAFAAADAAYKAYDRGEYAEAVNHASDAVGLAPDNRPYRLLLVNALLASNRLEEAEQAVTEALVRQGNDSQLSAQLEVVRNRRAQAFAASAYKAFDGGSYAEAAASARQALQLVPSNRNYQLLLVNALYGARQYAEAEEAVTATLATDNRDSALLAQRGFIRQRRGLDTLAAQDFEAALGIGALPVTIEIGLLADLGRMSEARLRFDAARAGGGFDGSSEVDIAYLAARLGDDEQALAAFNRADASGKLANTAYQDAAFAALRSGHDAQALAYFKRTVDDTLALKLRMEPQLLFNTRRAVAEVSREGGFIASLSYRGASFGLGGSQGAVTDGLQGGVEAYWRPWGYENGRYAELFARAFQTLSSKGGGATGPDTLQTAVGARYKPLASQNLVVSFSRVFSPSGGRNDWLAQLGYSVDRGGDLRVDVPSWWTIRGTAELGRYLSGRQSYALAELRSGKSFRLGDGDARWVLFPHLSLAGDYDSGAMEKTAIGFGPGITARYWFREDRYAAPRSYVDLSVHYRAKLSRARRADGLFVTTSLSY